MARMTGCIGSILAVQLLGCTRKARQLETVRSLDSACRTGQQVQIVDTRDAVAHEHGARESSSRGRSQKAEPAEGLRGTEVREAIMACCPRALGG